MTMPGTNWRESTRLEPHRSDKWSYWSQAHPRPGDTEARLQLRVATLDLRDKAPRDPKFWSPEREAAWQNASPLWSRYIPEYGITDESACIGQAEEAVRRPTLGALNKRGGGRGTDTFVATRSRAGPRTTPLISYNSIGWNRRHYEPIPDAARPSTVPSPQELRRNTPSTTEWANRRRQVNMRRPFGGSDAGFSPSATGGSMASLAGSGSICSGGPEGPIGSSSSAYRDGYDSAAGPPGAMSPPARIFGIDTASRPPLVVHSPTRVYRPAWIGVAY